MVVVVVEVEVVVWWLMVRVGDVGGMDVVLC